VIREEGQGAGIFLDLKLHDIPVTVERAMRVVADLGVSLTTVHCGESHAMLKAAVAGAGGRVKVLGVTVLTSVSGEDIRSAGFKEGFSADVSTLVVKRAAAAKAAGAAGIVCSGLEVADIKQAFGSDFLCVTPGIRPAWEIRSGDDQRRIVTPADAVRAGADYLVIGRPIRDAKDPVAAANRIAAEIATVI
jgi:orotidine-5'-phosphate decarboxylase